MKKNKMMRAASGLLVAVLLTTSVISGTFAKYTTSTTGSDKARVASWGFTQTAIEFTDLFKTAYDQHVNGVVDVIAPGTTNSAEFKFTYAGSENAPEVAYNFTVDTTGSEIASTIQENTNIQWKLDDGAWGTWDSMIADIKKLSGDESGTKKYEAGNLPDGFPKNGDAHKVSWQWKFDDNSTTKDAIDNDQNVQDTSMGNADALAEVTLKITITATQID